MVGIDDIVITGLGCITPIGLGRHLFWQGLSCGKCGTREIFRTASGDRILYGAPVDGFDGKQYVVPRKSLKLMSREVQISYAAAQLAWEDAGLETKAVEPERVGVIFGSEMIPGDIADLIPAVRNCSSGQVMDASRWGREFSRAIDPLWLLRNLPNMPPSHVGIAVDARGPSNTIVQEEVSGLLALAEAASVMQRGDADLMVVGAMGSRINPTRFAYRMPRFYFEGNDSKSSSGIENTVEGSARVDSSSGKIHSRAFDANRGGIVPAEAAVVLILEKRRHAVARSAQIYGTYLSTSSRFGSPDLPFCGSSTAIAQAAKSALDAAQVTVGDLACISAQGFSHSHLDRIEANAIGRLTYDTPVTAYSSYFGTAGAASALLQLAACLLATSAGKILPTLGYTQADPQCPIVICQKEQAVTKSHILQLGFTGFGQAAATVVDCQ